MKNKKLTVGSLQEAKQACFNGAVRGLASQHWKQSLNLQDYGCAFNFGGKTHCAVGWLIPAKQLPYVREASFLKRFIEERRFHPAINAWLDTARKSTLHSFELFLGVLMDRHDTNRDRIMQEAFKTVGKTHNLVWPSEVVCD